MGIKILASKKAQEEIVGFAMIVIIVSIIILFFLVFSLSDKNQVESYEAKSFLQSMLQHTSSCQLGSKWLDVQDLIVACNNEAVCENEEEACVVLNETVKNLVEESWNIGPDFPAKGYKIEAFSGESLVFSIEKGNATSSYEGAQQIIPESIAIRILFNVYY